MRLSTLIFVVFLLSARMPVCGGREIGDPAILVERVYTCGLIILYHNFTTIDLACATMPSVND